MEEIEIQEGQIRQLFASVVWTHKIQEKQADIYRNRYRCMETIKILLSALTSSGIISVLFVDNFWLKVVSAILSGISLFVSIYCETYDLKTEANHHKRTALSLLSLRERIISLLSDIKCNKLSYDEIVSIKATLYDEYFNICDVAKDTCEKAVNKATKALKIRKDNTYSDSEIDSFLPIILRKENNKEK